MRNKNRRYIRNLLINPEAQIRYGLFFMAASILVHAVTTVLAIQIYAQFTAPAAQEETMSFKFILSVIAVLYLVIYGFSFLLGLLISHRLYGPLVNIHRAMTKIKDGDFSARIVLRKNDDQKLKELADTINECAAKLEKKTS